MKWTPANLLWLLAYFAIVAVLIGAMWKVRRDVTAVYGTTTAQTQWSQWRTDAKEMADGAGPVKRREPKSPEPPALVLMRDHFAACLGLSLLLSTVLFATFMFFVRGAMASRRPLNPDP